MEDAVTELNVVETKEWVDVLASHNFGAAHSSVSKLIVETRDGNVLHLFMGSLELLFVDGLPDLNRAGDGGLVYSHHAEWKGFCLRKRYKIARAVLEFRTMRVAFEFGCILDEDLCDDDLHLEQSRFELPFSWSDVLIECQVWRGSCTSKYRGKLHLARVDGRKPIEKSKSARLHFGRCVRSLFNKCREGNIDIVPAEDVRIFGYF